MPAPAFTYQSWPSGVTPAASQICSSFLLVPESSPRETKVAPESAIFLKASAADVEPAMPAGSSAGPTITK